MIKIGHAYSDENNKARGGSSGDQTGKEVLIQNWYNRTNSWNTVFRAKDVSIAEKIAKTIEQACLNDNIGYNQSQRTTLYEQAKKLRWDLSKITKKCDCDCSSLVAVCVSAAGIKVNKNMYTGNQKAVLQATGKFEILTDYKYLTKPDYLKRGDILLGPGHTAIVISDNTTQILVERAKSFDKAKAGTYKVVVSNLNVRQGAGTTKHILVTIPKETKVKCYGYYTQIEDTIWLYVQFKYNNKNYTGFVSSKYLTK